MLGTQGIFPRAVRIDTQPNTEEDEADSEYEAQDNDEDSDSGVEGEPSSNWTRIFIELHSYF